jgi:FlaA1/EpsC-like NDP-sugar epimerase
MDEAIWCALAALHCATSGQIVMPACGEPVPLVETARRLAGWYRPEQVPYPITCTGIRPGERLHEVLLSPCESFADESPAYGLRQVRTTRDPANLHGVGEVIDRLQRLVDRGEREAVARVCLEAAEALQ